MDEDFQEQQLGVVDLDDAEQAADPKNLYLDVPYEKRWECLKPVILQLYLSEKLSISRLADRMNDEYSFSALYAVHDPASCASTVAALSKITDGTAITFPAAQTSISTSSGSGASRRV
jgi:hypothetical protein